MEQDKERPAAPGAPKEETVTVRIDNAAELVSPGEKQAYSVGLHTGYRQAVRDFAYLLLMLLWLGLLWRGSEKFER